MLVALCVALTGLVAGWLAAWLVHRYEEDPETELARFVPARCHHCDHLIGLADTVPVLSWLPGRGRCAHCRERLAVTWIGVQVAVPVLCVATYLAIGPQLALIPFLWLVPVLVVAATVDIRTMLIPRRIVWVGFGVGLALITVVSLVDPDITGAAVRDALIGAAFYFGFLYVTFLISPRGMGYGDVRLAMLLGLYLGWINRILPAVGLLIACVFGIVFGVGVRVASGNRQRHFPFGPGLAMGALVAIWFAQPIIERLTV